MPTLPPPALRRLAPACLVLSGAAGLICEVAWIRVAALQFGSTVHATSTVLAVFFLGLALGSRLFGDLSSRLARPLAAYGALELGVAALALASLPALGWAEGAYDAVLRGTGPLARSPGLVRAALVSLVLLPPAFLMGGTVPLFCRRFVRHAGEIGFSAAVFYGLNTLGGAAGCALAGFLLIPSLGVVRTVAVAASLSAAAGALALALASRDGEALPASAAPPVAGGPWRASAIRLGPLVFLAGFAALAQEVLWTRFLALVIRNTVHTYTLTLAVVLCGIVAGSLLVARYADRVRGTAVLFGALQAGVGLTTLALLLLPPAAWRALDGQVAAIFVLMLVPSVLSGATFPLAVRMAVSDPSLAGRGFGRITSLNTLGGIAGALLAGFVILPRMGLQAGTQLVTGLGAAAGCAAWVLLSPGRPRARALAAIGVVALAWFAIPRVLGMRVPADFLANGGELVAMREGLEANVAVVRREARLSLEIDRWWQGEARRTHQIMAAHLPMLLHPHPRRVVVVGVGAGLTPSRFLMHGPERLDCVDIEPAVFDIIGPYFGGAWMADPRVRLVAADGRGFLMHSSGTWDVVSLEVGQLFRPGVAAFYTEEFYRRVRDRLAPGGLVSQFVPVAFLDAESLRGVLRTFLEVFPNATLWYNGAEMLAIGGRDGTVALDPARLAAALRDSALATDLRYSQWGGRQYQLDRPGNLLGSFLCGPAGLAALARGGRVDRDDRPLLDYATAGADEDDRYDIQALPLLRRHLEPVAAGLASPNGPPDPAVLAVAGDVRERNFADMVAAVELRKVGAARSEGPGALLRVAREALRANPASLDAARILGVGLLMSGDARAAEAQLRHVVEERPDDAFAHRGLAVALYEQHRLAEAAPHFRTAIGLGLDEARLRNDLGATLAQLGDLEGAAVHFRRALDLRPGDRDASRFLALVRDSLAARTGQHH